MKRRRKIKSFTAITQDAETDKGLNNREQVKFHYFNSRGLYPELRAAQTRVNRTINRVSKKWGKTHFSDMHLVHGLLSHAGLIQHMRHMNKLERVKSADLAVWKANMRHAIDEANAWAERQEKLL